MHSVLASICVQQGLRVHSQASGGVAGLSPESVIFSAGKDMASSVHHYLLRPEALEAMFVMWHVTHQEKYREWAWQMFLAFEKHCKVGMNAISVCVCSTIVANHQRAACICIAQ